MARGSQDKNRIKFEKSFSERLKQIRERVSGSQGQADFARKIGIDPAQYYPYEKGTMPPLYVLKLMIERAGCSPYELLEVQHSSQRIAEDLQPYIKKVAGEVEKEAKQK